MDGNVLNWLTFCEKASDEFPRNFLEFTLQMVTGNELPPPSAFRYKFVSLHNVTAHGVTAVSVYYGKVVSLQKTLKRWPPESCLLLRQNPAVQCTLSGHSKYWFQAPWRMDVSMEANGSLGYRPSSASLKTVIVGLLTSFRSSPSSSISLQSPATWKHQ